MENGAECSDPFRKSQPESLKRCRKESRLLYSQGLNPKKECSLGCEILQEEIARLNLLFKSVMKRISCNELYQGQKSQNIC